MRFTLALAALLAVTQAIRTEASTMDELAQTSAGSEMSEHSASDENFSSESEYDEEISERSAPSEESEQEE